MTALSINVNKIALIRNSRDSQFPSVSAFAEHCVALGADGITAHPRPDQRHITARDCTELSDILSVEFNIEGNPFAGAMASRRSDISDYPGFMDLVLALKPAQCTLVPDTNTQLTSDHGFDLSKQFNSLKPIVEILSKQGIRVSLFMDADPDNIKRAADLGADRIELYTGPYAAEFGLDKYAAIKPYRKAADAARSVGLAVNAGHDLNLSNLAWFIENIPETAEVSIGHAFTVDCLYKGATAAMAAYKQACGSI